MQRQTAVTTLQPLGEDSMICTIMIAERSTDVTQDLEPNLVQSE